jgi:hypothetical protein
LRLVEGFRRSRASLSVAMSVSGQSFAQVLQGGGGNNKRKRDEVRPSDPPPWQTAMGEDNYTLDVRVRDPVSTRDNARTVL